MPTYVCYLPRDRFSLDQKRQIVDAITFRHSEATGAPSYFVQVVIEEARADRYLGGERTSDHIWVRGDIRAGRTEEQRIGLMTKMMQDISLVTSVRQENVWIYLCNLDPTESLAPETRAAHSSVSSRKRQDSLGRSLGNSQCHRLPHRSGGRSRQRLRPVRQTGAPENHLPANCTHRQGHNVDYL